MVHSINIEEFVKPGCLILQIGWQDAVQSRNDEPRIRTVTASSLRSDWSEHSSRGWVIDAHFAQIVFVPPDYQVLTRVLTIVSTLTGAAPPAVKQAWNCSAAKLRLGQIVTEGIQTGRDGPAVDIS